MPTQTGTAARWNINARADDKNKSSARAHNPHTRRLTVIAVAILLHAGALFAANWHPQPHYQYHPHRTAPIVSVTMQTAIATAEEQKSQAPSPHPTAPPTRSVQLPGTATEHANDSIDDRSAPSLIPGDHYFTGDEVTAHAFPIRAFPLMSNCLENAHVKLKLWISESGKVDRIEALETNLDDVCERIAESALNLTPFSPAKRGDDAVKSIWLVELMPEQENASQTSNNS